MESSWSASHAKLVDGFHVSAPSHTFCISVNKEAYKWNWICCFLLSLIHICILFVKTVTRQNIQYCCVFLMNRPLPKWLFLFLAGAHALVLKWLELSIQLPLPCLMSVSYITAFCLVDNIAEFDFFLSSLAISCYLEVFIWHLILFLIWTAYLISTLYSFYWLVCTSVFTTHL